MTESERLTIALLSIALLASVAGIWTRMMIRRQGAPRKGTVFWSKRRRARSAWKQADAEVTQTRKEYAKAGAATQAKESEAWCAFEVHRAALRAREQMRVADRMADADAFKWAYDAATESMNQLRAATLAVDRARRREIDARAVKVKAECNAYNLLAEYFLVRGGLSVDDLQAAWAIAEGRRKDGGL